MKVKLTTEQIRELLDIDSSEFPKYTTQLLNLANQNAQGTRPNVVGQLSELIQKFKGHKLSEWEEWYLKQYPEAIQKATGRILEMIQNLRNALNKIDKKMIEGWVRDLVIVKTFVGLRFQEAIIKVVADKLNKDHKLSTPEEESKGIDGYVGDEAVSIKPMSYKSKQSLQESIQVKLIYYEKEDDGLTIEF